MASQIFHRNFSQHHVKFRSTQCQKDDSPGSPVDYQNNKKQAETKESSIQKLQETRI